MLPRAGDAFATPKFAASQRERLDCKMKKAFAVIAGTVALTVLAGLDPELPSGDKQQLDRLATLGGPAPTDSLGSPSQPAPQIVPGER